MGADSDSGLPRRDFLKLTALALAPLPQYALGLKPRFTPAAPAQKGLSSAWLDNNLHRGKRETYSGSDLKFIGMPVGGICAGEVLVGGDGQLWLWDIFNQIKLGIVDKTISYAGRQLDPGQGANYVDPPREIHPFQQYFALNYKGVKRRMDESGWHSIQFTGEYPMAFNDYQDDKVPIDVHLETFSPYIPLETDLSGLPAVIQSFTFHNRADHEIEFWFEGVLESPDLLNTGIPDGAYTTCDYPEFALSCGLYTEEPPQPDIGFEDFERSDWGNWKVEGDAFGSGPVEMSAMPSYQGKVGGHGKRVACSFRVAPGESIGDGDGRKGRLTSPPFTISHRFIVFLIGGGNQPDKCCLNLVIDGKVVRSATGKNQEQLTREGFDVIELIGKSAHIEVVDDLAGGWGHITVDDIVFTDSTPEIYGLSDRPDYGTMALSLVDCSSGLDLNSNIINLEYGSEFLPSGRQLSQLTLAIKVPARGQVTLDYAWTWHFPNLSLPLLGAVKNHYASRFMDALDVANFIKANYKYLVANTKLWHQTWYDGTLPYWLLDRVMGNNATLATMTSVRLGNGRFYGWEGIGCCEGTCGHVWAYAQGPARLFPDLERSVRELVDFGVAFHPDTGIIDFRGEYGNGYATDAQGGYVLRAYREHQMSSSNKFLTPIYPRVKKALEYLIGQDGNQDGIIEGVQPNTLDVALIGASSWLSSIYLAALRAGKEMASEMGDSTFADLCQTIADRGTKNLSTQLWNGEYFIQKLDLSKNPDALRYGDGCEIDQVMGQWWADQVGLDRVIDAKRTKEALSSLYKYNFLTDVGPYRKKEPAGRWYAMPGEAGLLMCTFPKGDRDEILGTKSVWASSYFNECMSGFEYEAAAHMIAECLVKEGMAVTRAVHDRYSPSKRNPWNEVECSDHYARCMAAHSVFTALCGFEYHGPKSHIGFAPRISTDDFRAPFTAAEGWGTYQQEKHDGRFEAKIKLAYGKLVVKSWRVDAPAGDVSVSHEGRKVVSSRDGSLVTLESPVTLTAGQILKLTAVV